MLYRIEDKKIELIQTGDNGSNQNAPIADKTLRFIDKSATLARPEFLEA